MSSEDKLDYEVKDVSAIEYQNRYTVLSVSEYWKIDIIEYGQSTEDIRSAKINWEQNSKIRIEIEYSLGSFIKDILLNSSENSKNF